MAFGSRLRFFRNRKGLTQKQVGEAVGFKGNISEVRMAQYETEALTPKDPLINQLAAIYGVSPRAIKVPDIDTYVGLMHTLFALEDTYGLTIDRIDDTDCLRIDREQMNSSLHSYLAAWRDVATRYRSGEISKKEYDDWRYHYPEEDTYNIWAKVPPRRLAGLKRKTLLSLQVLFGDQ